MRSLADRYFEGGLAAIQRSGFAFTLYWLHPQFNSCRLTSRRKRNGVISDGHINPHTVPDSPPRLSRICSRISFFSPVKYPHRQYRLTLQHSNPRPLEAEIYAAHQAHRFRPTTSTRMTATYWVRTSSLTLDCLSRVRSPAPVVTILDSPGATASQKALVPA